VAPDCLEERLPFVEHVCDEAERRGKTEFVEDSRR
jgi:hypothetical protein